MKAPDEVLTPLDWLAEHPNYELSFSGWYEAWLVHSVNGRRSEWTLLATGSTPEEALRKAMAISLAAAPSHDPASRQNGMK